MNSQRNPKTDSLGCELSAPPPVIHQRRCQESSWKLSPTTKTIFTRERWWQWGYWKMSHPLNDESEHNEQWKMCHPLSDDSESIMKDVSPIERWEWAEWTIKDVSPYNNHIQVTERVRRMKDEQCLTHWVMTVSRMKDVSPCFSSSHSAVADLLQPQVSEKDLFSNDFSQKDFFFNILSPRYLRRIILNSIFSKGCFNVLSPRYLRRISF